MGGRGTRHRPSPPCGPARAETPAFFNVPRTSTPHTTSFTTLTPPRVTAAPGYR